ncbi:hypothetical protein [Paenirhodobacter populi]|uniref:hypothetical protein n=1 Tax=Paenirhodobacter populi TaxID=2306993 RepID=UPI0013E3553F|nr:hypothetical protein [Sinirhodobacter populi]
MCGSVWTEEGDLRLIGLLEYLTDTYGPKLLMNLFISMDIERGGEDIGATAMLKELKAGIDNLI